MHNCNFKVIIPVTILGIEFFFGIQSCLICFRLWNNLFVKTKFRGESIIEQVRQEGAIAFRYASSKEKKIKIIEKEPKY